MKKYLDVRVTKHDGSTFSNPLKLSEAYLISQLAQNSQRVMVTCLECNKEYYKSLFG